MSRLTHLSNNYYRIAFFNEFLSHAVTERNERFIDNSCCSLGLLHLLPIQCLTAEPDVLLPEELVQAAEFYNEDLPHSVMLSTEYKFWVRKWQQHGLEVPKKLVDAFKSCDSTAFPNIKILLQLALTVPITKCESERNFSQLKLLKTSHRSTISPNRLSGLALMKINRAYCGSFQKSPTDMKKLVESFY